MPTVATARDVQSLGDLPARMLRSPDFAAILAALQRGESGTIDGAWGSSCALAAAALVRKAPSTMLIVLPRISDVDDFAADLSWYLPEAPVVCPAWEGLPGERAAGDSVFGARLRVLERLESDPPPRAIVTSIAALMQPVPSKGERSRGTRTLRVSENLDLEEFLQWMVERGFERTSAVERAGEFSVHGGILDVFAPGAADPVRAELFGNEIESLRTFDVETQRKVETLREVRITALTPESRRGGDEEMRGGGDEGRPAPSPHPLIASSPHPGGHIAADASLVDSLPPQSWVALVEPDELVSEGRHYRDRLDNPRGLYGVEATIAKCTQRPSVTIAAISAASTETTCHLQVESVERLTGPRTEVFQELGSIVGRDETVLVACHNEAERERLSELLTASTDSPWPPSAARDEEMRREGDEEKRPSSPHPLVSSSPQPPPTGNTLASRVRLCIGTVTQGFRLVPERLVVLSDHALFNRADVRRVARRRRHETRAIDSFLELSPGDLVVHLTHGIGRFRGMELLERGAGAAAREHGWPPHPLPGEQDLRAARAQAEACTPTHEEHLALEFRDGVRLYVPVSLIHLVQKYVGAAKAVPQLSKVGGTLWSRQKQKVAAAVSDLASDMLRLQAERQARPGEACPPDSHYQQEFDASFPYVETDDQLKAILETKSDLEQPRPMDRLICGDVGFGKTEVAMRGAFKVVDSGRQVAILVPTTVLAEQHFRTFSDRMAEFPVTIESLSRFKTKAEQREIIRRMAAGAVDIVIGTHRIVQPDVAFKDLGLLIIDEEQRFGVEAKEVLKRLRLSVDVLTMSATPIPRTLHMSLLGIRDISNLTTPPQDRTAIETRIGRWDGDLIRHAVVRELNRDGQVYFVHNRVYNIRGVADRLQSIVPEARIGIVHGQMPEHELEDGMLDFVAGRIDVLVATTIIESGLDIPNANTIFIHQADKYGLADLHQLRGRVGRYKHRAYCYLILEEGQVLTRVAARRLKAIEEFSELGAGFKIAMRDLEIRGAGNILGTEQSGHITTVGYELYCQLLENAVRQLKGEAPREHPHVSVDLPVTAYLPNSYVPPGRHKIDVYRKLSAVSSLEELREFGDELRDRFGPVPGEAGNLLAVKELQLLAHRWGIEGVRLEEGYAVFPYRDPRRIRELANRLRGDLRIVDSRSAYLVLPNPPMSGAALVAHLKSVLR